MAKSISVIPPEKELVEYKEKVSGVKVAADNYVVASQDDFSKGADLLRQVKDVKKFLTDKKEEITRPLMQALASVRDLFKPLEGAYADAEKTIKAKMLAYQEEEETRIAKEKERIANRVEKGTMRADTAAGKLENLGDVATSVSGSIGKVNTRVLTKVRVIDESIVPREYLSPNLTLIAEAVLRKGIEIPGVEKYEEKVIVSK